MFRTAVSFLIGLALTSLAAGESIRVTSASATYWSSTDDIEFVFRFDRPMTFPGDYIQFGGGRIPGEWPPIEGFGANNSFSTRTDEITLTRTKFTPSGGIESEKTVGLVDYSLVGTEFRTRIPFEWTDLSGTDFSFAVYVRGANTQPNEIYGLEGLSAVDHIVTYVPEPSALLLAAIGGTFLLGYRRWLRQRR